MKSTRLRRWCTLAGLLAAECFSAASSPLHLPFYRQKKNGCGAASVAMVMRFWAERRPGTLLTHPSPDEVYEALYRPQLKGIRLADMKGYLEDWGFRAFTLRGDWADVEGHVTKGRPLIVSLRQGRKKPVHFAVVSGVANGFVWLSDPTRKAASRMGRAEFEKRWELADRWMLLAMPAGLE